jgi:hypothetical protein
VRVIALLGALALARRAGFTPKTHEFFAYHVHAHLDVLVNGRKIRVPPGIGIDIADPAVHRFREPDGTTGYGGSTALQAPVHLAAAHARPGRDPPHRVGPRRPEPARKRYRGDPRAITLTNLNDIVITVGCPPHPIPSVFPH